MNYYAVVFLLRPPDLLRRGPFSERENVCNSQENDVRTRCAAIVNHRAIVKILRVVNLLRVVFLVRRRPLGNSPQISSPPPPLSWENPPPSPGLSIKKRPPPLPGTSDFPFPPPSRKDLQSHPPVTGVLKWEILESALGSAPEGALGNRGAPGSAPESAQENWGCSRECSRECSFCRRPTLSTLRSTPSSTPNFPEHSREHSLEHPDFPEHPREHFREHFQGFPTLALL